jgi:hypothetical protein
VHTNRHGQAGDKLKKAKASFDSKLTAALKQAG